MVLHPSLKGPRCVPCMNYLPSLRSFQLRQRNENMDTSSSSSKTNERWMSSEELKGEIHSLKKDQKAAVAKLKRTQLEKIWQNLLRRRAYSFHSTPHPPQRSHRGDLIQVACVQARRGRGKCRNFTHCTLNLSFLLHYTRSRACHVTLLFVRFNNIIFAGSYTSQFACVQFGLNAGDEMSPWYDDHKR